MGSHGFPISSLGEKRVPTNPPIKYMDTHGKPMGRQALPWAPMDVGKRSWEDPSRLHVGRVKPHHIEADDYLVGLA